MSAFNAFLIWLLCIGIAALIIGYFLKKSSVIRNHEGFKQISTCPDNSEKIVDDAGRNNCCKGDIVETNGRIFCSGNIICSLTETFTQGTIMVPLCSVFSRENNAERSKNLCPELMPNYSEGDKTKSFCSKSSSIPADLNEPYCILYNNSIIDANSLDSCQNYMKKREMEANLNKCERELKTLKEQSSVTAPATGTAPPTVTAPATETASLLGSMIGGLATSASTSLSSLTTGT